MLQITIPACEQFDERTQQFVYTKEQTLTLEHSLVSLSKWESKWNKVFMSKQDKTLEETMDYIKCMTLTQNVKPEVYNAITPEIVETINKYIAAPMTATTFSKEQSRKSAVNNEAVTAELIYYWMIALNIPKECEKWHLNKLLTLVKVCEIKNQPPKKRSCRDIMTRNAALNAARRKQFNSKG